MKDDLFIVIDGDRDWQITHFMRTGVWLRPVFDGGRLGESRGE